MLEVGIVCCSLTTEDHAAIRRWLALYHHNRQSCEERCGRQVSGRLSLDRGICAEKCGRYPLHRLLASSRRFVCLLQRQRSTTATQTLCTVDAPDATCSLAAQTRS
jgi:hypothetical protein